MKVFVTGVEMAEDDDKVEKVRAINAGTRRISLMYVKKWIAK